VISRILSKKLERSLQKKSVLILGPRQVGKSTLLKSFSPHLSIHLADESVYLDHLKNPALLKHLVSALDSPQPRILIDEIQRIPSALNTIQALIDQNPNLRFLLSGSSARKLARGRANLLPGRILYEKLHPLTITEIRDAQIPFNLEQVLISGFLPEPYLDPEIAPDLLSSYAETYLREELQGEGLVKNIGDYARFLDLAAELSGQYLNYAKLASDTEIGKDTIRSYFNILEETLLIHRLASFGRVDTARKSRQKDKFYFFDLGVRNAVLKKIQSHFTNTEKGPLLEHLVFQQLFAWISYGKSDIRMSSYRDDRGLEIDFILENETDLLLIEVKYQKKFRPEFEKNLLEFEALLKQVGNRKKVRKQIIYVGEYSLKTEFGTRVDPVSNFFENLDSSIHL